MSAEFPGDVVINKLRRPNNSSLAASPCFSWKTSLYLICLAGIALAVGCSSVTSTAPSTTPETTQPTPPAQLSPVVSISGPGQVRAGSTVQLTATVTDASNTIVTWSVNGVTGGTAATGTISAGGTYTPPATPPAVNTVTIAAITQALPSATATLVESILNPVPVVTLAAATPTSSTTNFALDIKGSGFLPASQIAVNGGLVATAFVSASELTASTVVDPTATSVSVTVVNPDPGSASSAPDQVNITAASLSAAGRILEQATFGPTLSDIVHVQKIGIDAYLAEQFAIAPTPFSLTPASPATCTETLVCMQSQWWETALTGADQLRERVAFALSQILVVSTDEANVPAVMAYHNILTADAFGNFSTLLKDVTLSTAMGEYLNMLNSDKPQAGQIANENYARELMQLFTLGLVMLNPDGTPEGSGTSVFSEAQVEAFARAYTGWTYATSTGAMPPRFPNDTPNYGSPMAPVETAHDTSTKTLLLGTTLPAGQSAEQDLDGALANIFNHPNVGPFVCKQLIQHLVTSNPEPAYVARVASVFANNGQGVRGDMKAVITAILTDPDARAGDITSTANGGHLRDAVLWMSGVMRGLGFVDTNANRDYSSPANATNEMGETPYGSPSVFNFYPPDYVIPGTTLTAPEFGEENTSSTLTRLRYAEIMVFNNINSFAVDLSPTSPLGVIASQTGNAQVDSGNLVDALGVLFLHAQMPPDMRTAILNHVSTLSDIQQRVRVAAYLVITSSFYKIEH